MQPAASPRKVTEATVCDATCAECELHEVIAVSILLVDIPKLGLLAGVCLEPSNGFPDGVGVFELLALITTVVYWRRTQEMIRKRWCPNFHASTGITVMFHTFYLGILRTLAARSSGA